MRFGKSIKLGKGIKVNFSKSGPSLTAGVPGLSINIGGKGAYINTGIPGTGISKRTKIGGSGKTAAKKTAAKSSAKKSDVGKFAVELDDDGKPVVRDGSGRRISDEARLRRIKATDEYKEKRDSLLEKRADAAGKQAEQFNANADSLIYIHRLSAKVSPARETDAARSGPITYTPIPYEVPEPTEREVREELLAEAKEKIKSVAFWTLDEKYKQYVDENYIERFTQKTALWEREKNAHDDEQLRIKAERDREFARQYEAEQASREAAAKSGADSEKVERGVEEWLSGVQLPIDCSIQYQYAPEKRTLYVDADLPEIEDMPCEKAEQTSSGALKMVKKTQKELRESYASCVFGVAIFFSSHLFCAAPETDRVSAESVRSY